nr:putative ribonuclease H-like domain-containing protein [Tanacetum cinerariifolium]
MAPKAVLLKSGIVNTARQNLSKTAVLVNTARQVSTAHPKSTVNAARKMSILSKSTHSSAKRPIDKKKAYTNSNVTQKVNTVRSKIFNTARPKAVVNVVQGNKANVVKASTCWVWKPKTKVIDHDSKHNIASITLKKFDYDKEVINSGCLRHMIGNKSYLIDYEEVDRGYVAFGGNPKGRKITLKGSGANWVFDIDALTKSMNYKLVVEGNQSNGNAGTKACDDACKARMEIIPGKDYILLPLWTVDLYQEKEDNMNNTNNVNADSINTINVTKKDERGIVIRKKSRLVSQGHTQEEGIDYKEVFAPVAIIKAIKLFLAYASFKDFMVYQMDVKSAFLYGKIEEEVYICQPPGFKDPDFLDKVYKVKKALYGLHQAPRAWAKTVNGEGQLQALVDGKMIIITESTIRRDLQIEDVEGVDCLPNVVIFEQLPLMGLRKTKRKDTKLPQTSVPISVVDEAVKEEMDKSLERAVTTATILNAE